MTENNVYYYYGDTFDKDQVDNLAIKYKTSIDNIMKAMSVIEIGKLTNANVGDPHFPTKPIKVCTLEELCNHWFLRSDL